MSEYGYIPEVAQSFGDNTGVFDPADINNLVKDNKWTQYGQLELIETKTITASSSAIFTSIQESTYNVHFLTVNNFQPTSDNKRIRVRLFENGVEETGSVYQVAAQIGRTGGSFIETRSTGQDHLRGITGTGNSTNESGNGYMYFYNLGDNTKYSFTTNQSSCMYGTPEIFMEFGSGVLPQASLVDQIKIFVDSGTFDATASLYGIKEYS